MTIVDIQELLDAMDNPELTEREQAHIEAVILPGTQNALEKLLNRKVEKSRIREALSPDERGYLIFSETPVWEVVEIMRPDGTLFDLPQQAITPPTLPSEDIRTFDMVGRGVSYEPFRFYTGYRNPYLPMLTMYEPSYWVTYYAGYLGEYDEALKADIIKVAAREVEHKYIHAVGMRQGSIEPGTETDDLPIGWTEEEVEKWDRIRRRVVV